MTLRTRSLPAGVVAACAVAALAVAGCSSGKSTPATAGSPPAGSSAASSSGAPASAAGGGDSKAFTVVYIQKQGTQQYFVDEATGAKDTAAKLGGITVDVVNVNADSNAAINAVNTAIAQKAGGIVITVPDQKIGPQVIDLAKKAGIPLIATDDPIQDSSGAPAPFVGFDSTAMGEAVGKKAGELYKATGWSPADTRIINVEKQDLSDCVDRGKGALDAFKQVVGADIPKVIDEGTDATTPDALNRTGAVITANPGVKHWVVWGCNDESETGAVTALQNAGFGADSVVGVGLGAYLTCKDWKAGKATGNKAALFISGKDVGATAIKEIAAAVRQGTPLPPKTIVETHIVDPTNWQQAGVACT